MNNKHSVQFDTFYIHAMPGQIGENTVHVYNVTTFIFIGHNIHTLFKIKICEDNTKCQDKCFAFVLIDNNRHRCCTALKFGRPATIG